MGPCVTPSLATTPIARGETGFARHDCTTDRRRSLGLALRGSRRALDAINTGSEKALEILHDLSCAAGAMYADIVADPPDPDYETIADPRFAAIDDTASGRARRGC